jgi:hypothetical protein
MSVKSFGSYHPKYTQPSLGFGQLTLLYGFHLIKTPCNTRLNFFYHRSGQGQKEKSLKPGNNLKIITRYILVSFGSFG